MGVTKDSEEGAKIMIEGASDPDKKCSTELKAADKYMVANNFYRAFSDGSYRNNCCQRQHSLENK